MRPGDVFGEVGRLLAVSSIEQRELRLLDHAGLAAAAAAGAEQRAALPDQHSNSTLPGVDPRVSIALACTTGLPTRSYFALSNRIQ